MSLPASSATARAMCSQGMGDWGTRILERLVICVVGADCEDAPTRATFRAESANTLPSLPSRRHERKSYVQPAELTALLSQGDCVHP
jgi:hypothetical protein